MGTVHQLIERVGRQEALKWAETDADRRAVEAAIQYMADEEVGVGFLYSGWCQAALPHKRLTDDQVWKIETERVALVVEPGRRNIPGGATEWVGVPYGSRARLILLYLQSEALRTNSRDIELGRSLHAWLGRLGIPIGGKSFKDVREQAERLSRCRLTFHIQQGGRAGLVNQNIVDTAMFVQDPAVAGQGSLFLETARLSETFFEQLKKHPVPLEEAAIRAISNNSQALDVYCWLAYRLHVLPAAKHVSWKALFTQFGASYKRIDHFKERFIDALKVATAVYRHADVEIDTTGRLAPPVPPPGSSPDSRPRWPREKSKEPRNSHKSRLSGLPQESRSATTAAGGSPWDEAAKPEPSRAGDNESRDKKGNPRGSRCCSCSALGPISLFTYALNEIGTCFLGGDPQSLRRPFAGPGHKDRRGLLGTVHLQGRCCRDPVG